MDKRSDRVATVAALIMTGVIVIIQTLVTYFGRS
jgi:hypothetical protein